MEKGKAEGMERERLQEMVTVTEKEQDSEKARQQEMAMVLDWARVQGQENCSGQVLG